MRIKSLLLGLVALTAVGSATDVSNVTKITKIYTYGEGAVIRLKNPTTNNSSCSYNGSGEYLAIRFNTQQGKELYSAALSAFISSTNVKIGSSGCDDIWGKSKTMNKVYRVELTK